MRLGSLELDIVRGSGFRLDGGAMFGIVPKVLWEKKFPADERNRIRLATNREFATKRRVSLHGLRSWLYKLRRERGPKPTKRVRLLPVEVRAAGAVVPSGHVLELAVDGVGVRFTEGTSVEYVASLVGALRGGC